MQWANAVEPVIPPPRAGGANGEGDSSEQSCLVHWDIPGGLFYHYSGRAWPCASPSPDGEANNLRWGRVPTSPHPDA